MHHHQVIRRAFTLVELLVVIAIIGILVALTMPAIQSSRESGRRFQCANNLKQHGLALNQYLQKFNVYPPGLKTLGNSSNPNWCHDYRENVRLAPWTVTILPYLEEDTLYRSFDLNSDFSGAASAALPATNPNEKYYRTPMPIYKCPTDLTNGPDEPFSNYMGVQGGGLSHRCAGTTKNIYRYFYDNGLLFLGSSVKAAHVHDGLTKTFLVGESTLQGYDMTWATGWKGGSPGPVPFLVAASRDALNTLDGVSVTTPWNTGLEYSLVSRSFSSFHTGVCQFVMGDGTVHTLTEDIDLAVYRSLGIRNDGEPNGKFTP